MRAVNECAEPCMETDRGREGESEKEGKKKEGGAEGRSSNTALSVCAQGRDMQLSETCSVLTL